MTTVRLQVILTVSLEDGATHSEVRAGVLTTLLGLPVVTAVEIQTSAVRGEPRALAAADVPVDRSDFLDPGDPPREWDRPW